MFFNKTGKKGADMYLSVSMYLRHGYPLDAIPAIDAENHVYDTTIDAWIPAPLVAPRPRSPTSIMGLRL